MSDGWFDEDVAETYDEDTADTLDPAVIGPQLDLLAALADGGRALEFAIGTGRIAIPLASRGVPVAGIELSRAMVARLRAKPGGDEASIPVTIGDMTTRERRTGRRLQPRLPRLQHRDERHDAGRPGRVVRERRPASVAGRTIPDRNRDPGSATAPARREVRRVRRLGSARRRRRVRPRHATDVVASRHDSRRRADRTVRDSIPLRVALRARPHGSPGGHDAREPLGGLDTRRVHERQPSHVSVWRKPACDRRLRPTTTADRALLRRLGRAAIAIVERSKPGGPRYTPAVPVPATASAEPCFR